MICLHTQEGNYAREFIQVGDAHIVPEHEVTLLGVTLDSRLNFSTHINNIQRKCQKGQCSRTNCQIFECNRRPCYLVPSYIHNSITAPLFGCSPAKTQQNYCPLVWMFSSKNTNKKIDGLHKRILRLLYDNYTSNYEELLLKDDSVCVFM